MPRTRCEKSTCLRLLSSVFIAVTPVGSQILTFQALDNEVRVLRSPKGRMCFKHLGNMGRDEVPSPTPGGGPRMAAQGPAPRLPCSAAPSLQGNERQVQTQEPGCSLCFPQRSLHTGGLSPTVTQAALVRKSEGTLNLRHPAAKVTALHGSGDQALGTRLWARLPSGELGAQGSHLVHPRGHVCESSKDPLLPTYHSSQETGCYLLTNTLFFLIKGLTY